MNTVTSFFTGSGSQTDARRTRTSSTSAGSGKGVPTANSTVKRTRSAGSFGSTVKCPNNLGVKEVVSALSRLWNFFGPDEMTLIEFQAGLTASAAVAYQSNLFNGQSKLIPGIVAALSIQVGSKIDNVSKWLTKMFGRSTAKVGSQIGNFGKLVNKPNINWTGSREHALNQMKKRGVSEQQVKSWINTGKVIQQDANTFMYVTKDGVAILNKQGVLQTAYGKAQFKDPIKNAIKQLYGD